MPGHSFKFILPAASLPAEGGEPEDLSTLIDDGSDAGQLLSRLTMMTRLIGDAALVLNSRSCSDDDAASMETVTFSTDENATPHVELAAGDDTQGITKRGTQAFARALERYRASSLAAAGGSDCERFAESLAIAFNEAGFSEAGAVDSDVRRVPLLAERDGQVMFYGVWEARADDLEILAKTWSGDAASGWLPIGDDDEVEGRGLREAAFGLAAFGLIATSLPGRALADSSLDEALFDLPTIEEVESGFSSSGVGGGSVVAGVKPQQPAPVKAGVVDLSIALELTDFAAPNSKQAGARIDLKRLKSSTRENTRIIVDVAAQRAFIAVDGLVIGDMPVSTARSGKYTPRGTFHITQKKVDKVSTIYHVALPYWMRLDQSAIGLHVGELPGRPASAGCIRLPKKVAQTLYSHVQSGTPVDVVDHWSSAPQWMLAGT